MKFWKHLVGILIEQNVPSHLSFKPFTFHLTFHEKVRLCFFVLCTNYVSKCHYFLKVMYAELTVAPQ